MWALCWRAAHPVRVLRPQLLAINQGAMSPTYPALTTTHSGASVCPLLTIVRHLLLFCTHPYQAQCLACVCGSGHKLLPSIHIHTYHAPIPCCTQPTQSLPQACIDDRYWSDMFAVLIGRCVLEASVGVMKMAGLCKQCCAGYSCAWCRTALSASAWFSAVFGVVVQRSSRCQKQWGTTLAGFIVGAV